MIYFTSDMHFSHNNIIKYCNRPFDNILDMDIAMIENWNNTVKDKDDVYILGDISFYDVDFFLEKLKGRKYLIRGNHDSIKHSTNLKWIKDYFELHYYNKLFILCHYPFESWNGFHKGAIHLHGHQHSQSPITGNNRIDVGVDAWNFHPVSIDKILGVVKDA